jgi:hypothetical protein
MSPEAAALFAQVDAAILIVLVVQVCRLSGHRHRRNRETRTSLASSGPVPAESELFSS